MGLVQALPQRNRVRYVSNIWVWYPYIHVQYVVGDGDYVPANDDPSDPEV